LNVLIAGHSKEIKMSERFRKFFSMGVRIFLPGVTILLILSLGFLPVAFAASASEIDRDAAIALDKLYARSAVAQSLSKDAIAILVFPSIIKGGFVVGGQYGEGALLMNGKNAGYYKSVAASYGLQAGAQTFGYALFFMNKSALSYLQKSEGWEIGVGPTIVIMDEKRAVSGALTTTTGRSDIYAFFFSQKGLMAGLGLQGTKMTRFYPKK
jgi:lipid-binding SYLF domain-containing protein